MQAQASAISDSVAAYGRSQGWTPAVVAEHQAAAATAYHDDILQAMMQGGQVAQANGWFAAHRDAMTAEGQNAWAPRIQAAYRAQQIGLKVDAAMNPAAPPGGGAVVPDLAQVSALLAADPNLKRDPTALRDAMTEARARFQQQAQAQRQADDAAAQPLVAGIAAKHGTIDAPTAAGIAQLSPQGQAAVKQIAADAADPPVTDYRAYAGIHAALRADPAAFAAMTGLEVQGMIAGKLNPADQREVVEAWTKLKDQPPGAVFAIDDAAQAAADKAGIDAATPAGAERLYGVASGLRR